MNEKEEQEPLVTRLSLLSKVRHGDEDAWSEFYGIYRGFIYGLARRGGLLHEDAEDLTQDTMAKIAEHIEDFKPDKDRARFRTWLETIVRHKLIDRARKAQARPATSPPPEPPAGDDTRRTGMVERVADLNAPNFESLSELAWQAAILEAATKNVRAKAKLKHLQIYDLYELREMPAAAVAKSLGVLIPQVYLTAFRVKRAIIREAKRLKKMEPMALPTRL